MSDRGDDGICQSFVRELNRLKGNSLMLKRHELQWLRSLAFTYIVREDDYIKMIDNLIETIAPLAVAERLKQ
jgi:hypothetical protein